MPKTWKEMYLFWKKHCIMLDDASVPDIPYLLEVSS